MGILEMFQLRPFFCPKPALAANVFFGGNRKIRFDVQFGSPVCD
jgi:hypothetical protein